MEGTVNRVLLEVRAGGREEVRDLTMGVECSSSLVLVSASGGAGGAGEGGDRNPSSRTPYLVRYEPRSPTLSSPTSPHGATDVDTSRIPPGWQAYANGWGKGRDGTATPVVSHLTKRGVAHASFDLYRPLKEIANHKIDDEDDSDGGDDAFLACRTSYVVTLSYRQMLPASSSSAADGGGAVGHRITREHRGAVTWHPPLKSRTSVRPGVRRRFPSGSRHPTNALAGTSKAIEVGAVVDGDEVNVRCSLEADTVGGTVVEEAVVDGCDGGCGGDGGGTRRLGVMVQEVSFQNSLRSNGNDNNAEQPPDCEIELVTGKKVPRPSSSTNDNDDDDPNVLFSPKPNDICHMLRHGSRFTIAYTARPQMTHPHHASNTTLSPPNTTTAWRTSARLGALTLKWIPLPLPLPSNTTLPPTHGPDNGCYGYHGPLPVPNLHPILLDGPVCYVESTPFRASRRTIPSVPKVACPFEVRYRIGNRTEMHQKIRVAMNESGVGGDGASTASGIGVAAGGGGGSGVLVSGLIGGEMSLGPKEVKEFSYLMLFTTVGRSTIPTLHVSSIRYGTWIVHGDKEESVFVTP